MHDHIRIVDVDPPAYERVDCGARRSEGELRGIGEPGLREILRANPARLPGRA